MTSNRLNILITDADFKHTLGIVRSIGKRYSVFVLSFHRHSLSSFSRFCKGELIIPNYDKPDFLEKIIEIFKLKKIDVIIPVGSNSVRKFSDIRDEINKYVKILLPPVDSLRISLSKNESIKVAKAIGIPCPKTYEISDINDIDNLKEKLSFPCVIKSPAEVGYNIVDYVNNKDELLTKYHRIAVKVPDSAGLPIVQEYIEGVGCGFFALYLNGECGPVFMHKRVREFPPSGGYSTAAESIDIKEVEKYGRLLLDHLKWNGIAMVEFKLRKGGIPYFMEINPKFWGSTELAIASGVNFPELIISALYSNKISYSKNYKLNIRFHWPFNGDIGHSLLNPRAIFSVMKDCLSANTKSNFRLFKDPLASVMIIIFGFYTRCKYFINK